MMETAVSRGRLFDHLQLPLVALETLTILRLRRPLVVRPEVFGRSQAFFPAAGLLLGGLVAGADWLLRDDLGASLTGWLLVTVLVVLTGGLHIDGLADTADGVFGAQTPERRLAIMHDSSIGAFGVAGLILVLAIKATALGSLAGDSRAEVLILAPALSRWACVAAIAAFPAARPDGLGASFHAASWPWPAPLAGAICLAACAAGLGPIGVAAWAIAATAGLALGALIGARLGGLTGDTFGAIVEVSEALILVLAVSWSG